MNKRVEVWLQGGLGNQLFQYGFGYWLSVKQNRELHIREDLLPSSAQQYKGINLWPNEIRKIRHSAILRTSSSSEGNGSVLKLRISGLESKLGDRTGEILPYLGRFSSASHKDWQKLANQYQFRRVIHLKSYFQDYRPMLEIRKDITSQILENPNGNPLDTGWRGQGIVAVHIRLGDLRTLEKRIESRYISFYRRGLQLLKNFSATDEVALFSDEPVAAELILRQAGYRGRIDSSGNQREPLAALINMSKCSGLLATPSSFAWWAGFLQSEPTGPVVFRAPWPGDSAIYRRMLPSWIGLE